MDERVQGMSSNVSHAVSSLLNVERCRGNYNDFVRDYHGSAEHHTFVMCRFVLHPGNEYGRGNKNARNCCVE